MIARMANWKFLMTHFVRTSFALVLLAMGSRAQPVEMQPFTVNWKDNSSDVNASFLLDAPAGKDGFVRVKDGHLAAADGRRLRLWGVNISLGPILRSKTLAEGMAANLSRLGINCVRIMSLESTTWESIFDKTRNDTQHIDPAKIDAVDLFVSELKKRGIYVAVPLNVGRMYKPGDGVADWDSIGYAKGITYFDGRVIELEKGYAKALLTHYNPYTKSEYRNEPALLVVEMLNENSLLYLWKHGMLNGKSQTKTKGDEGTWKDITPHYGEELAAQYNAWLAKRLTPAELEKLRKSAGVADGAPIPRLASKEIAAAPALRFHTEEAFYMDLESGFFRDMRGFLKDTVGVKSLLIGTSDMGAGYTSRDALSQLDIIDAHDYWQHPHRVRNAGGHTTGFDFQGLPKAMVNDPFHSTVMNVARSAMAGKPFTVTEVNHHFPNDYASEGIPIMAAYAAFQDWDGVFWYAYAHGTMKPGTTLASTEIWPDPVKSAELLAGAFLFGRADVKPAREIVARTYSHEQVLDSMHLDSKESPFFTPGFPLSLPFLHGERIGSLDGPPTAKFDVRETSSLVSDTKELTWDTSIAGKGLVTIDAERTQALIGFVTANGKKVRNLSANVKNDFCAIILSSLDGAPISRSAKMLLITGARSGNTGMKWNAAHSMLAEEGTAPTTIEPVMGTVALRGFDATAVEAQPLDGAAKPMGQAIGAKKTAEGWEIAVGRPATPWYAIRVKR
jgi:hypothetical protein